MSEKQPVVLLSTCGDAETAEQIARHLIESQVAACVNVVPQIKSVYRWQGKVESAQEALLVIKSVKSRLAKIEETIKQLSGYDLPELIALDIVAGSEEYLNWLKSETTKE